MRYIALQKIQQTVNPGLPVMYPGAAYPSPQLGVPMGTNPYYAQGWLTLVVMLLYNTLEICIFKKFIFIL